MQTQQINKRIRHVMNNITYLHDCAYCGVCKKCTIYDKYHKACSCRSYDECYQRLEAQKKKIYT